MCVSPSLKQNLLNLKYLEDFALVIFDDFEMISQFPWATESQALSFNISLLPKQRR